MGMLVSPSPCSGSGVILNDQTMSPGVQAPPASQTPAASLAVYVSPAFRICWLGNRPHVPSPIWSTQAATGAPLLSASVNDRASTPRTGFENDTLITASWYTRSAPGRGYVNTRGGVWSAPSPTLTTVDLTAMGTAGAPSTTAGSVDGLRPSHRPPSVQGSMRKLPLVSVMFPRNFAAAMPSTDW